MLNNPEIASDISPNDPIGIIVSKEHLGRVRGLSHGARPTLAFKQSTTRLNGMNFASCNATSTNTDEKFMKMENDLTSLKNQMQILVAYIPSRDDVPEHFVVMAAGLVHPSVNQVKFNILFNKLHKFIIIHIWIWITSFFFSITSTWCWKWWSITYWHKKIKRCRK